MNKSNVIVLQNIIPDGFVSLSTYLQEHKNLTEYQRFSIISYLWNDFVKVTNFLWTTNNLRMLSLHADNIFIKVDQNDQNVFSFAFSMYIPEIFFSATLAAFIIAADATIAVPCWSS